MSEPIPLHHLHAFMAWTACVLFLQLCLGFAVRVLPSVFLGETVVFIVFLKHVKEFSFLLKLMTLIKIFLKIIHTVHHINIRYFYNHPVNTQFYKLNYTH